MSDINLLNAKPFWMVVWWDGDLSDGFTIDEMQEISNEVFDTESGAHTRAKEIVEGGEWDHAIVMRVTSLGTYSKVAQFLPSEGVTKARTAAAPESSGKRRLQMEFDE